MSRPLAHSPPTPAAQGSSSDEEQLQASPLRSTSFPGCSFVLLRHKLYWFLENFPGGHLSEYSVTRKKKWFHSAIRLDWLFFWAKNSCRGNRFYSELKDIVLFYFNLHHCRKVGWCFHVWLFFWPSLPPLEAFKDVHCLFKTKQNLTFILLSFLQVCARPQPERQCLAHREQPGLTPDVTSFSVTPFIWMIDLWN